MRNNNNGERTQVKYGIEKLNYTVSMHILKRHHKA